jgi:hypothetical protein
MSVMLEPRMSAKRSVSGVCNAETKLRTMTEPSEQQFAGESLRETAGTRDPTRRGINSPNDRSSLWLKIARRVRWRGQAASKTQHRV